MVVGHLVEGEGDGVLAGQLDGPGLLGQVGHLPAGELGVAVVLLAVVDGELVDGGGVLPLPPLRHRQVGHHLGEGRVVRGG